MLKFGMTLNGGERGLGLILEKRNLELLSQDRPMLINLADIGLGFVKRKKGRGRILLCYSEDPRDTMEQLSQQIGIPMPNPGQAIYTVAKVQPEMRCYCAALGAPCACRG